MGPNVDNRESVAEMVTAGLLMIVFALFLLGGITEPLAMLAGGVILLGSGIYQTTRGWHVSLITWILGLILALGGIGVRMFLVTFVQINWVAIALLAVGGWLLLTTVMKRRG
ncbi:MAG: hypothetical protein U0670_13190 [Anaerolineae bacterium]